jgi:spermidine/putrescine transport system permease protein
MPPDGYAATDITTAPEPKRRRVHMSLWDRVMRHSDIGIGAWAILVYIFLYMPIAVLIVFSFNSQRLNVYWEGFTLHWYRDVVNDPAIIGAFVTSLEIAVLSTLAAVVIATLASFSLERFEYRTKMLWDGLNYTKIIIAEVVAGVSSLLFFVQLHEFLLSTFGFDFWSVFSPGFWTVLFAHIAWNIPFAVIIIRARLKGFDRAIEEAGADLGANPPTVFFKVTLPVIAPGIMAASLLCFTLSFDDFVTTFFVIGQNYNTLPVLIWGLVRMGISPKINALSAVMIAISASIVIFLELKARISKDIA